ncbi:MAG: type II toxin-antitoxin system RelE/ParE family toxin [Actinobacteria bacterium]|nr:type II toxin-antitoxin system RelE/ParE family toxin [Actinomycetota bacterium]
MASVRASLTWRRRTSVSGSRGTGLGLQAIHDAERAGRSIRVTRRQLDGGPPQDNPDLKPVHRGEPGIPKQQPCVTDIPLPGVGLPEFLAVESTHRHVGPQRHSPADKVRGASLASILGPIAANPQRLGKPLLGEGLRSARRGDYRIIYEIFEDEQVVLIHRVQHRRDVYRPR